MTKNEYITEIRLFCSSNANNNNVAKYSKFFRTEYIAYGLTQPQVNSKAKELAKTAGLNLQTVLDSAPELIKSGMYEETSLLLLTLNGFRKQFDKNVLVEIEKYYKIGIQNWAHADTLGMIVIPKFLLQNVIHYSDLSHWIQSELKFQRRTVPVALIKLLKTTSDFNQLFTFIEPLILDPEREVHQGVGWFLREAWKKQREVTEAFLLKWKDSAPRLIIQYATEKMTPEEKLRFKRVKNKK
jgi:3-methyladenine DNA glycosylase AlkD